MAKAPEAVSLTDILVPVRDFNSALDIDRPQPDTPLRSVDYTVSTDDGLASLRSKHRVRSPEELAAATSGAPALGTGLSLRMAMAGQAENNQFPFTDPFGKQRT